MGEATNLPTHSRDHTKKYGAVRTQILFKRVVADGSDITDGRTICKL